MSELENLPHPTHMPSLNHHIFAFFTNAATAQKAASLLNQAGIQEEDLIIFEGPEGVEALDIHAEHSDPLERFFRRFVKFSAAAEWKLLTEADEEVKKGHILMGLAIPNEKEKNRIVPLLKNASAYNIRYCSGLYIEDVV